jgi:hypothetical protein
VKNYFIVVFKFDEFILLARRLMKSRIMQQICEFSNLEMMQKYLNFTMIFTQSNSFLIFSLDLSFYFISYDNLEQIEWVLTEIKQI